MQAVLRRERGRALPPDRVRHPQYSRDRSPRLGLLRCIRRSEADGQKSTQPGRWPLLNSLEADLPRVGKGSSVAAVQAAPAQ